MVTCPARLGPESDSAGKAHEQLYGYITDPPSRQGGYPTGNHNFLTVIKIWSRAPGGCPGAGQTGRLTDDRKRTFSREKKGWD
jgi:hypothetical protein